MFSIIVSTHYTTLVDLQSVTISLHTGSHNLHITNYKHINRNILWQELVVLAYTWNYTAEDKNTMLCQLISTENSWQLFLCPKNAELVYTFCYAWECTILSATPGNVQSQLHYNNLIQLAVDDDRLLWGSCVTIFY